MTRKASIIGHGVISCGWAERLPLKGWVVRVFDPKAKAHRKLAALMANARPKLQKQAPVAK